jgi:uncharacterized protein DUF4338
MKYCGRQFSASEIDLIRELIGSLPSLSRYKLSTTVCTQLDWRSPNGGLKDMSCRVAMLRMQTDGLLELPPARRAKPITYGAHPDIERAVDEPSTVPEVKLDRLTCELVGKGRPSWLWNAYIQRYHYLGHQPMPGAQLRYVIRADGAVVALLGFGASAWKVKPRDEHIGWSTEQRQRNLHLVVNNARFLILPWICCPNLASKILSMVSRRIADDWHDRYLYRPVLLETFVEAHRFRGTCYQAANWQCLGRTQGRGKIDTHHRNSEPIKSIWTYPLVAAFRKHLHA